MREVINVRQIPGDRKRRWFSAENFDLVVWLNDDESFSGFELCYDKTHHERAIVWRSCSGFEHMEVDDGERRPGKYKASPVLLADGYFDANRIHSAFSKECGALPQDVAAYVLRTIERHPNYASSL